MNMREELSVRIIKHYDVDDVDCEGEHQYLSIQVGGEEVYREYVFQTNEGEKYAEGFVAGLRRALPWTLVYVSEEDINDLEN